MIKWIQKKILGKKDPPPVEIKQTTPCKIVILGASNAGKTSLIKRFVNNMFNEYPECSIGAAFIIKNFDDLRLEIWDTAGSERYHQAYPSIFYRFTKVALVSFSNDRYQQCQFQYAKQQIKEMKQKCIDCQLDEIKVILVETKIDLESEKQTDDREVQKYCKEQGIQRMICSAKTNFGVEDVFHAAADLIKFGQISPVHMQLTNQFLYKRGVRLYQILIKMKDIEKNIEDERRNCVLCNDKVIALMELFKQMIL